MKSNDRWLCVCVISLITLAAFDLTLLHTKAKKRTTSFGSISSVPYTEKRRTTSFDSNSTSPYIYTQCRKKNNLLWLHFIRTLHRIKKNNLLWLQFNLTLHLHTNAGKKGQPPLDPFQPYILHTNAEKRRKTSFGSISTIPYILHTNAEQRKSYAGCRTQ